MIDHQHDLADFQQYQLTIAFQWFSPGDHQLSDLSANHPAPLLSVDGEYMPAFTYLAQTYIVPYDETPAAVNDMINV